MGIDAYSWLHKGGNILQFQFIYFFGFFAAEEKSMERFMEMIYIYFGILGSLFM